jgi:diguanylate cyclase (GGDEF)-like protein
MLAIERLLDIATQLSSERDLDRLLNLIIDQTSHLLNADRVSLFLVNGDEDFLEAKIAQGLQTQSFKVPIDQGVVGWVARNRELLNIEDAQLDSRLYLAKFGGDKNPYSVHSMLCVPLLDGNQQLHGVIQAMRSEIAPFNREEETLIRAVASQATVAIRNALLNKQMEEANANLERKVTERTKELRRMNRELEEISITDALTGAYNRRYFNQLLMHEKRFANRYGATFSLIMFDIDHFKKINDHQGHDAGDAILRQMIEKIRNMLRDCDFLFRYGGEEFTILLPRTGLGGAATLAERIREHVANLTFNHDGMALTDITISLGVAAWIEADPDEAERLLQRADQALYDSKRSGRNRVTCSGVVESADP